MNYQNINKQKIRSALFLFGMYLLASCSIEKLDDPNNPGAISITQNASLGEIQNLVDGVESGMRNNMGTYWDDVGVIGREFYRFSTSDPRFTSDLLGKGNATLDNNTFYITNPFAARYRVVKNTNILIDALTKTNAAYQSNDDLHHTIRSAFVSAFHQS